MANRITRHIPNTITCCNLLSGCMAVMAAFHADAWHTLVWVVAGALFDFCDGLSARLIKAYSPLGKELDSLADLVTFGLAPAMLCLMTLRQFSYGCQALETLYPYIGLALVVFAALRLAKFTGSSSQRPFLVRSVPDGFERSTCRTLDRRRTRDIVCRTNGERDTYVLSQVQEPQLD